MRKRNLVEVAGAGISGAAGGVADPSNDDPDDPEEEIGLPVGSGYEPPLGSSERGAAGGGKVAGGGGSRRTRGRGMVSAGAAAGSSNQKVSGGGGGGRSDISTPRLGRRRKSLVNYDKFPSQQSNHQVVSHFDAHDSGTSSPLRPSFHNGTKRARSPVPSADDLATSSTQSDSESKFQCTEMQPKAKRLAPFNVELSQPIQILHDLVKHKPSRNKENQASSDKCNADEHTDLAYDLSSDFLDK
ncbi:hypothetical protein COCNU_01G017850 [Cocos nucifera]|uniref:Uncharacterized protein n=1 Tax=Cocos nucifera TaxID=13894 RepID=A0A8K0MVA2_COCNU|nr:hypothetical protein COCNU_01G017850 [Cocos nucifera]